ncbi:hypothetical protein E4T66_17705 [Sinimarinibacterium sp. CAU 1509]|uniref:hypothetical protein n=1 Tax=Sinimarinibacterium sp. CAU 1509 TaxID=2562283 RepID=UPI0010AB60E3|nr:hypothetical protein [Sinimarinibacterium sp. CAU 1509]TJY57243.1 hypothetical protein E4T66_17705 [Sinimarinibacterium sp. CAU 1509]
MIGRTPFEDFRAKRECDRFDFVMTCHNVDRLLVTWLRCARGEAERIAIHRELGAIFDELALPFFDEQYVAALAACPMTVERIAKTLGSIRLSPGALSMSYTKIGPDWPAPNGVSASFPFLASVVAKITALGADPTEAGYWQPFVHPVDRQIKVMAAGAIVRAQGLTERKVRDWLAKPLLRPDDVIIVESAWERRPSIGR